MSSRCELVYALIPRDPRAAQVEAAQRDPDEIAI